MHSRSSARPQKRRLFRCGDHTSEGTSSGFLKACPACNVCFTCIPVSVRLVLVDIGEVAFDAACFDHALASHSVGAGGKFLTMHQLPRNAKACRGGLTVVVLAESVGEIVR